MLLSKRRIDPAAWQPVGVTALEQGALDVVRSAGHTSVIAGPGAGKTELLAQRAAFLLQTGAAPAPQRILAISFKRDAAVNLAKRVAMRVHPDLASRFDSMTFDAFAKSLIDRFSQALPDQWRPSVSYEILFPTAAFYRDFLNVLNPPSAICTSSSIRSIGHKSFERTHLLASRLPSQGWPSPTPGQWATDRFWRTQLDRKPSELSFPMLGQLAELLVRLNIDIGNALRLTYSHVFMDEFQDITRVQYDLMSTIFRKSNAVITAVGDNKQQIMRWALALPDPFKDLAAQFGATRVRLLNNYRSSPGLVAMQHVIAQALDGSSVMPVAQSAQTVTGSACVVWDCASEHGEAFHLAGYIAAEMASTGLPAREFAVLVRQRADAYANALEPAFSAAGVGLRNEATYIEGVLLQDLLTEEAARAIMLVLSIAVMGRAGARWRECVQAIASMDGVYGDDTTAERAIAKTLNAFATSLGKKHRVPPETPAQFGKIVSDIVGFLGKERMRAMSGAYRRGDWMDKVIKATSAFLEISSRGAPNWASALANFRGDDAVPLMTIHRSKGLEYHTVFFVGLDDGAMWNYKYESEEETAAFFVAFTRAKQRVVFTYCASRALRNEISPLYDLLKQAGASSLRIP